MSWLLLAPVLGCFQRSPNVTPPNAEAVQTDGELRPPVEQRSPNASGQTPAFEGQTRAPQPSAQSRFTLETVAEGMRIIWGLEFLPDGRMIVNERPGRMRIVSQDGTVGEPIAGLPEIVAVDQAGLLDVALDPAFAENRYVYASYAEPRTGNINGTAVFRARLSDDERSLQDLTVIFRQEPGWNSTKHYGSRLVFTPDGNLFVTLGERSKSEPRQLAQDPTNHIGTVVRIRPDGSVPEDNPFVGRSEGADEVWSYGHRNLQAATLDGAGQLWTVEHGPRGGDELNRPQPGTNYGWPVITYGENYNGQPMGAGITAQDGLEQPVYYWDPVIAPSGMDVYDGTLFPGWSGNLLIGGLQAQAVVRLDVRDGRVFTEEWLDVGTRVRDVKVGPDGAVYVGTDVGDILRLVPAT